MLYAAAMVLDADPKDMIAAIGYTGEEVMWPKQVGAKKKRGLHPQEIIDFASMLGLTFVHIEVIPRIGWSEQDSKFVFDDPFQRFERWIEGKRAFMIVRSGSVGHAIAWDGKEVYDPKGFKAKIDDYEIESAYVLAKLI